MEGKVPGHIAFIMDGNGRWAKARGLSHTQGHQAGSESLRKLCYALMDRGVKEMSVYAFSTENWKRSGDEIAGLRSLIPAFFKKYFHELQDAGVNVYFLGEREGLAKSTLETCDKVLSAALAEPKLKLYILLNYGGRQEIISGIKKMLEARPSEEEIAMLSEESFRQFLYAPEMSDPDLIIRTAGEQRLSNFLLWQSAYSEFYYSPVFWPDFNEEELDKALADFASRTRRFGGRP